MTLDTWQRPVIGLTMGDAAGIGSEIIAKAAACGALTKEAQPVIVGDKRQLEQGMRIAKVTFPYKAVEYFEQALGETGIVLLDTHSLDASKVRMGELSAECGKDSGENMRRAAEAVKSGFLDALCFGPNNKAAMKMAGYSFHGMVDLLAQFFAYSGDSGEINVVGHAFNARVTGHIPISDVSAELSVEGILKAIHLSNKTVRMFGIAQPRIAVAALNPHAGDNGTCGKEEITLIKPAVDAARAQGLDVTGPLAADTLFVSLFKDRYDIAVTMYHDQGQIAFKLKDFDSAVTVYGGIPYPVGTGAHGTAYDCAGQGVASPGALISAYQILTRMAKTRMTNGQQRAD
jgi:4-hydroxythreonine-4-phosphate dehydrogenase